ncbi:MAG TPA: carboxypeptidase-like regulatory domain-containing protein [Paludibacteraceae bacterium]|nr:carboxypeptidase-like regulatory domain-containing protein [Paludibacteraceae bacterium]
MKKSHFSILCVSLAFLFASFAQAGENRSTETKHNSAVATVAPLEGRVIDKNTHETLAGVKIIVDGQKVYTDLDGHFVITNVAPRKLQLKASMISYEDQIIEVEPQNMSSVQIQLEQF